MPRRVAHAPHWEQVRWRPRLLLARGTAARRWPPPTVRTSSSSWSGALTSPSPAAPNLNARASTAKHTQRSHPLYADGAPTIDAADLGCGRQASPPVPDGSAPTGRAELLPFLLHSSSAVEPCRGIVYGSAASIPLMRVSEALAILVYRLVFDRATRAKELSARARGATSTPFPRRFPSASASPATPRRVSGSIRS